MALYQCPECQNDISEKAKACPHCGAVWAGICPECHLFRGPNTVTCEGCGYPFSTTKKLKDRIEDIHIKKIGSGKLWMNFWIYISLPLGAFLSAATGLFGLMVNGQDDQVFLICMILFVVAVAQILVAVGLAKRRILAFSWNLFLIFLTSLTFFGPWIDTLVEPSYRVNDRAQVALFIVGLILAIVWWIPNERYWRKRQEWFH